jgi:rhodanese-related sulfurtransferase
VKTFRNKLDPVETSEYLRLPWMDHQTQTWSSTIDKATLNRTVPYTLIFYRSEFLDLRYFRDQNSLYDMILPRLQPFRDMMKLLNIKTSTRVVLYDNRTNVYAARAYFMLRAYGLTNVQILDGGLKKWVAD